jgi:VIT1/CCC1 family predicted Fe2+/Mn2+ transporter
MAEIVEIFQTYDITPEQCDSVVKALSEKPKAWVDFMMRFELGLEAPDPKRALTSALTIAGAYVAGGLIPLAPYMIEPTVAGALPISVAVTAAALAVFGYVKGRFTGAHAWRSALQTTVIGGLAAGAAFAIARAIG